MYEMGQEEIDAVAEVIRSGQLFRYRGGEGGQVDTAEKIMRELFGCAHALTVTSGTGAIICGLVGLELGPAFCLDVACRGRCRLEVVVHLVDVRLFDGQLIGQDLGRVWGVCFGQLDPSSEKDLRVHATPRIQELF